MDAKDLGLKFADISDIQITDKLSNRADAYASLHSDYIYKNFETPSEINVSVTQEDFAAGFIKGVQVLALDVKALKEGLQYIALSNALNHSLDVHKKVWELIRITNKL